MLLHGIEMTFIIAIGSWLLAMTLAILLLALRFSPGRFGECLRRRLCLLSPQRPDARPADAVVLRHLHSVAGLVDPLAR